MSITIQNIDPHPRKSGQHRYALRVNGETLCEFTHNREDGIYHCLRAAAFAWYVKKMGRPPAHASDESEARADQALAGAEIAL